ncbi:MAG: ABC transporter ATP-binding protein [Halanaerobiaceae bacterium]
MGSRVVKALDQVSLEINQGELIIIKGPSGSGKTTMLNIMGGLDSPTSGIVYFNGQKLNSFSDKKLTKIRRENISFIFQSFGLIQSLTAFENVEVPLRIRHESWKKRRDKAYEFLDIVGLKERADHRIFELSGGEQQRVGIARALVTNPSVILADEPTGEVDYLTGRKIMELFQDMVAENNVTICVATHDPGAMDFGDRSFEIKDGQIINKR